MDHECGEVENTVFSSFDDLSLVIDSNEIAFPDQAESYSKWVDPKRRWFNRISEGDMTSNALIKTMLAEDSKSCCESTFQVLSLDVLVVKNLWLRDLRCSDLHHCLLLAESRFKWSERGDSNIASLRFAL